VRLEIPDVTGDIPALGRLIVTDMATQNRRHVEWGLENVLVADVANGNLIDSDSMSVTGLSGTQTTTTGAYDPNASGNNSITCALISTATGVAKWSHGKVGSARVKVRLQATNSSVEVRLVYQSNEGPWIANEWKPLLQGGSNWEEIDLGAIAVVRPVVGSILWNGRLEARTTTGTATLRVDYVVVMPTDDGYGKARTTAPAQSGVLVAYDQFTSTTAGNALNARVAPAGGTWATSGAATDFVFADSGGSLAGFDECASRTASGVRYAILGATNYADVQVRVKNGTHASRVIARWVDSNNHLYGEITGVGGWNIVAVIAGTPTSLAMVTATTGQPTIHELDLTVRADGTCTLVGYDIGGVEGGRVAGFHSALATGGALDDGKPGFADDGTSIFGAVWDDFFVFTPPAEDVALYSGETMQFRHDDVVHENAGGTDTSSFRPYRGSRFLVPVGDSYVTVKARRADIELAADANVTDSTRIQVGWTPRGLVVPR
jgi:hypothetical protein